MCDFEQVYVKPTLLFACRIPKSPLTILRGENSLEESCYVVFDEI